MAVRTALTARERELLEAARRAVLATAATDGSPRAVPICFAVRFDGPDSRPVVYSALDEKPKRGPDPHALARVRDLLARPSVTVLADVWNEDWSRLAWVQLRGSASLMEPGHPEHAGAVMALRARYPQYVGHALESRPIVRVEVTAVRSWSASGGE
jgi:PPOX class probable F420-dependent enzyme